MKHAIILALAAITTLPLAAQTDLGDITIDAQLRLRGEYRNGQGSLRDEGVRPATFVNERARIGMGWQRDNLSMKFSFQHTGVYGDTPQQTPKNGDVSVNEAWAKLVLPSCKLSFQVGRQILSYDDERILGGLDWATTGRSHDALRVGYADANNTLHAILAYNQKAENRKDNEYVGNPAGYKTMQGLWYHYDSKAWFQGSLLFMNIGVESEKHVDNKHVTRCMQIVGTHLTARKDAFTGSLSGYYEMGRNINNVKVKAYMLSASAKLQLTPRFSLAIADDYLSGNGDNMKSGETHVFDVLYGTHHKFYGTMDYFNSQKLRENGLNDLNLTANIKVCDKVDIIATGHYFAAAHKIPLHIKEVDDQKTLGSEIDLQLNWSVMRDVTIQGGYSIMAATKALESVAGGNRHSWQDWGWISLNVNPRIFSTKKN